MFVIIGCYNPECAWERRYLRGTATLQELLNVAQEDLVKDHSSIPVRCTSKEVSIRPNSEQPTQFSFEAKTGGTIGRCL